MKKLILIPLLLFLISGCNSIAPTAPSWKDSLGKSSVEPVNKDLTGIQKILENKNNF